MFLTIVLPVLPIMTETTALYVSLAGEYGSLLNRTYLLNTYLVGSLVGAAITYSTPRLSGWISELRGRTVPFQGLALTFGLLSVTAAALEVLL